MVTLNTLRTRGGVIVSIVIGLALVAFLLGDLMSSGGGLFNSRKMRVGTINGTSVEYIEFANEADRSAVIARMMSGRDALTSEQQDAANNMAWDVFVRELAYKPGLQTLGVAVGEQEQIDMVNGVYISPVIANTFANPATGIFDPALMKQFVSNLDQDQTGHALMMWDFLKEQMQTQREMSKFIALVAKGLYVTDLEVKQSVADANNMYSARYIQAEYATIADSTIKITTADIKKYFDSHKEMFKQAASRDIEYVVFDLVPSPQDYADAQKAITDITAEFAESDSPMQYATLNSQVAPDQRYYKESQLDPAIAAAVFGKPGAIYGPVLNGDMYTVARLVEMKNMPDSIGAMHILLPATDKTRADSLVTVLKAGGDFGSLAMQFSQDQQANQQGGDLGIFTPDQMIPEFSEACVIQSVGTVFTVTTQFGIHVVKLTHKTAPVNKAQVATIKYNVDPSPATQQVVYAQASKFISEATGSYEAFKKAATESALSKRVARIRNTERNVSGIDDSRELVRWTYNGNKGDVSQIMELGGDYVIAAITDVREDGYADLAQAEPSIRPILIQKKKGEELAAKMQGASLDAIASTVGSEVKDINDLQFSAFYIDGVGVEPKLIGAICGGAKEGALSKPVMGNSGVYLFDINKITPTDNATLASERVRMEAMAQSYLAERLNQAMIELSGVKDMRVKFF